VKGEDAAGETEAEADDQAQDDWVHGWSTLEAAYSEAIAWADARWQDAQDTAMSLTMTGMEAALAAAKTNWAQSQNSPQATREAALETASSNELTAIETARLAAKIAQTDGDAQWVTDVKQGWITGTNAVADHAQTRDGVRRPAIPASP
jgi:hypothetical protein